MAKTAEVEHVRADLKQEEEEFKVYSLQFPLLPHTAV